MFMRLIYNKNVVYFLQIEIILLAKTKFCQNYLNFGQNLINFGQNLCLYLTYPIAFYNKRGTRSLYITL